MKTQQTNKSTSKLKLEQLLGAALVLVLLGIVVFALIQNFKTPTENIPTLPPLTQRDFIEVSDATKITVEKSNYILPQNWKILANYKNPSDAQYKCSTVAGAVSTEECVVYEISDDTNTFFASLKVPLVDNLLAGNTFNTTKINFLGESKEMFVQNLDVVTRTDESEGGTATASDSQFVKQAYICAGQNICFSTGMLGYDVSQNAKLFDAFKLFISGIKLEK